MNEYVYKLKNDEFMEVINDDFLSAIKRILQKYSLKDTTLLEILKLLELIFLRSAEEEAIFFNNFTSNYPSRSQIQTILEKLLDDLKEPKKNSIIFVPLIRTIALTQHSNINSLDNVHLIFQTLKEEISHSPYDKIDHIRIEKALFALRAMFRSSCLFI